MLSTANSPAFTCPTARTVNLQNDADGYSSAAAAAEAAAVALDDLRQLVRAAERERNIDLLESFEHFDRRGQVGMYQHPAKIIWIHSETWRLCTRQLK